MHGWFPENVSTYGGDIDRVFYLILFIVAPWFLLTQGAILFFSLRYRRGGSPRASYLNGEGWRQASWVLVPAAVVLALDLGIDAAGVGVWHRVKLSMPAEALHLDVTAKQFEWLITYPGPDGRLGTGDDFTLDTELHVPARRNVRVTLRSRDVLHSFFLPNVRLKQDVVPGRAIDAWFNVTRAGTYPLACAELCGLGHYTMKGRLVVHEAADFERWMREKASGA